MDTRTFTLTADGTQVFGIAQFPDDPGPHPAVLICHGFKGFMEWGFFPPLAEFLVAHGCVAIRWNYSGSGMQPGDELVTNPGAFKRNTYRRELTETLWLLATVGAQIGKDLVDLERVALLGHSRGGAAANLVAAHPDWHDRVRALVTWSAISTVDRFDAATRQRWRETGALPVQNARTGQQLELGLELLADIEHDPAELDLLAAAARRRAPWLIVHGEADESVPVAEARELFAHAAGPKELCIIPGANHTFGARHPFAGVTPELAQAIDTTWSWLQQHLLG